jgi:5-methylcytosine-specific restriction endonuclease McrA
MMSRQQQYLDYLESPEWWALRKRALQRANYRCERCGRQGALEIHHRDYGNLGKEQLEDLEVLCPPCHRRERWPRNQALPARERLGQMRLFERWDDDQSWPTSDEAA